MIKWLWQLPQHLLGLLLCRITAAQYYMPVYIVSRPFIFNWGVSLGQYIILNKERVNDKTIRHEYGHSLQSLKLGPLYLLIVGLPSITMNILTRLGILKAENYYKRWPESWADKLGGVER